MEDGGKVIYIFLNIFLNLKHELRQGGRKHMTLVKNLEVFFLQLPDFSFSQEFSLNSRKEGKSNITRRHPRKLERKKGGFTQV